MCWGQLYQTTFTLIAINNIFACEQQSKKKKNRQEITGR